VVELVNNNVVEGVRSEVAKVCGLAEGLDRGEEHVGGGHFLGTGVEAEGGFWADAAEGVERLAEDLLAVGDEEYALGAEAVGVEGREPGFSGAGGEDDESGGGLAFWDGAFGFHGLGAKANTKGQRWRRSSVSGAVV